ncbi:MAG: glycosyltransferase family 4 protein [Casimicrobiaceae bacterium]
MRIAFYAPLKAPDHPVPSGDRRLGALLMQALRAGGHDVQLVSRFRSFDGAGDAVRQARIGHAGRLMAARLVRRLRRTAAVPDAWFTYHVYHKAPDWLGPTVSRALDVPYIVAEASIAPRQHDGPWAIGHEQARIAITAADAVVFVNPVDVAAVMRVRGDTGVTRMIRPFIDVAAFAGPIAPPPGIRPEGPLRLVAVGMLRHGAKLASYRGLAAALARLPAGSWLLDIVGEGPARAEVAALFGAFAAGQVRVRGAGSASEVAERLRASDVCVWPAIDEAFGMALLEAQACGLPVVAGDGPGIANVVADGRTGCLVPAGDVAAFAAAVARLGADPSLRVQMGHAARAYVCAYHDIAAAAEELDQVLAAVRGAAPPTSAPGSAAA